MHKILKKIIGYICTSSAKNLKKIEGTLYVRSLVGSNPEVFLEADMNKSVSTPVYVLSKYWAFDSCTETSIVVGIKDVRITTSNAGSTDLADNEEIHYV